MVPPPMVAKLDPWCRKPPCPLRTTYAWSPGLCRVPTAGGDLRHVAAQTDQAGPVHRAGGAVDSEADGEGEDTGLPVTSRLALICLT